MISGLTYLRLNLNLLSGDTSEDVTLQRYLDVAEYAVIDFCDGGLSGYTGSTEYPVPVTQAIILLASHYYFNRNMVAFSSPSNVPYTFQFLLSPYKNYAIT